EDLEEIERGLAYLDYTTRYQCTATALAKKLGKHVSTITRAVALVQKLPPDIRDLIGSGPGKLPPFAARQLVRLPDAASKRRCAALYVEGTAKTAPELAAAIKNRSGTAPAIPAGFTCEQDGVKLTVTLPPGQDLATAAAALRTLLKDLKDQGVGKGLEHF